MRGIEMKDINWYINRLKAMSMGEFLWRVQQKNLQGKEKKEWKTNRTEVIHVTLEPELDNLHPFPEKMHINWENQKTSVFTELDLFHTFSYSDYKRKWNAGFQTEAFWPKEEFSYDINCSQRVDIGDIRTNWELNRHYQFAALAKSYYLTGNPSYYTELKELFFDWNQQNPFLWGVEWTSPMEIAIRVNSWIFMYCFLDKASKRYQQDEIKNLLNVCSHGIKVMVEYIIKHRSRYSSANNHLIVEMYAVQLAGIFYDYQKWIRLAMDVLTKELVKQNYPDGVNKEMSLHYQSFIMEAYGLLILFMQRNHLKVPKVWFPYLNAMAGYLCDCRGVHGETLVFGDNDEGKILDLCGKLKDHYGYVLDLMGCILEKRYTEFTEVQENINWLVTEAELGQYRKKQMFSQVNARCYQEGGYTILRSRDNRIFIGIDHAELGFGKLAAHGHADALSFQLFLDGIPVFTDAGTYNYHITPKDRESYMSSSYHNTITIDEKNQSELLGPFLWGKRAHTKMLDFSFSDEKACIRMETSYQGIRHFRKIEFDYDRKLIIKDHVKGDFKNATVRQNFLLGDQVTVSSADKNCCYLSMQNQNIVLKGEEGVSMEEKSYQYAPFYNCKKEAKKICYAVNASGEIRIKTTIQMV